MRFFLALIASLIFVVGSAHAVELIALTSPNCAECDRFEFRLVPLIEAETPHSISVLDTSDGDVQTWIRTSVDNGRMASVGYVYPTTLIWKGDRDTGCELARIDGYEWRGAFLFKLRNLDSRLAAIYDDPDYKCIDYRASYVAPPVVEQPVYSYEPYWYGQRPWYRMSHPWRHPHWHGRRYTYPFTDTGPWSPVTK